MSKKYAYFLAVISLALLRLLVLNTNYDEWLASLHYDHAAKFILMLRNNPTFVTYYGNWILFLFVFCVLGFWISEEDDDNLPRQFLLLPIAFVPFSIVGAILANAEFRVSYLYVHPLVVVPFGYVYIIVWVIMIWLLEKLRIIC